MKQINYKEYFEQKVQALTDYVKKYNLEALVLGISGGIDSTVCAAICYEVSRRIPVKVIGRSLPTMNNKEDEVTAADLVGNAFCTDYKEINIQQLYNTVRIGVNVAEFPTTSCNVIANGNIQARLRMIYLYNLASVHKGIVIDTDNLTEHNLGYFTIHGDQGDVNPIGDLWKTQVFELANYIFYRYDAEARHTSAYYNPNNMIITKLNALKKSISLKPTAGLGITSNDLEEIGAESYEQVDSILQEILAWKRLATERGDLPEDLNEQKEMFLDEQQMLNIPIEIIINVTNKHFASEFKRKQMPIRL
jgi:NAD+ synthetase